MSELIQISGGSDRAIVFVHGRSFKPAARDYLDILISALTAGIECDRPDTLDAFVDTTKILAYYGDLSSEFLSNKGEEYDEMLDVADLLNALHELKTIDRVKGFGVSRYDRLPGKSAYREFAISMFAPIAASLGFGKKLVSGRQPDLGEYWRRDSALRAAVIDRVRDAIAAALDRFEHVIVIAHGTGSIVAFDALWQLSHAEEHAESCNGLKVDVWLTLGTPLGDSMVRRELLGGGLKGRQRFPTNVVAWHNVAAEDDYVCYDNTVADDFRAMLKQRQISSIRDYRIYNMTVRYGRSNPHNVLGYLVHPRAAKIVADWIGGIRGRPLPRARAD